MTNDCEIDRVGEALSARTQRLIKEVFASFVFSAANVYNMILIIAYGNNLREDDGAGLLLAERLATIWHDHDAPVRHLAVQQLAPELAADIAGEDVTAVVFVDTRLSPSSADLGVGVVPLEPIGEQSPSMGHHFQPGLLLAYAQTLFAVDPLPPAWLVTVPGVAFGYGERISEDTQMAIQSAFDCEDHPLQMLIKALTTLQASHR